MRLDWLADELHDAGVVVRPVDGWEKRGRAVGYSPRVIVDHHTAGPLRGSAPSLGICVNGRTDVPGPLCNILTGRDGEAYVIASGRSNNAGKGGAPQWDATSNRHTIGHEIEHTGNLATEPVNTKQLDVAALVDATICTRLGWGAGRCIAHKEWAPGRKIDPIWSQHAHRKRVAERIEGAGMSKTLREIVGISMMFYLYEFYRDDLPEPQRRPGSHKIEADWRDRIVAAVEADAGKPTTPALDHVMASIENGLALERARRDNQGANQ
jgi:hypothetical protein